MTDYTRLISHNFSSRNGQRPKLLVLHDTESHDRPGVSDLDGLRNFFDNPGTMASAHKIVDQEGNVITCVRDDDKAWHVCQYNGVALGLEQVGFASLSRDEWMRHRLPQLQAAARTLAGWHVIHGVPLRRGRVARGIVLRSGIVEHMDLGMPGCGHDDCGAAYPRAFVTTWARLLVYDHKGRGHAKAANKLRAKVKREAARYGHTL